MILSEFLLKLKNHSGRLSSNRILAQPGEHHSPRKTLQAEIEDRRPYYQGDDLKYLDWKQYARSDRYYVKQSSTPSKSKLIFILDNSSSMFYHQEKYNNSALTMLALIYNALQSEDSIAVSLLSENHIEYQKRSNFQNLYLRWLENESKKNHLALNIEKKLSKLLSTIPVNSYVVFLSDLYLSLEDLKKVLLSFHNRKSELLILHSLHSSELKPLIKNNWTRLIDMESSKSLLISPDEIKKIPEIVQKSIHVRKQIISKYHSSYYFLNSENNPFYHVSKLYGGKF